MSDLGRETGKGYEKAPLLTSDQAREVFDRLLSAYEALEQLNALLSYYNAYPSKDMTVFEKVKFLKHKVQEAEGKYHHQAIQLGVLSRDNERLLRGEFTEKEFQNLCHNIPKEDVCKFRAGCESYQKYLLGKGALEIFRDDILDILKDVLPRSLEVYRENLTRKVSTAYTKLATYPGTKIPEGE